MATQANRDSLSTALSAKNQADIKKYGSALLGELRNGDPKPTGGELDMCDSTDACARMIHAINWYLRQP